jgi:hypothetical protein
VQGSTRLGHRGTGLLWGPCPHEGELQPAEGVCARMAPAAKHGREGGARGGGADSRNQDEPSKQPSVDTEAVVLIVPAPDVENGNRDDRNNMLGVKHCDASPRATPAVSAFKPR